jgi:hypothetical protein
VDVISHSPGFLADCDHAGMAAVVRQQPNATQIIFFDTVPPGEKRWLPFPLTHCTRRPRREQRDRGLSR